MKRIVTLFGASALLLGCESTNYAPPVTSRMAKANSTHGQSVELNQLRNGRALFVHRCIECHTLPAVWKYTSEDWRDIVQSMSHRASLTPAEQDAVVAYILAARAQ